MTVNRPPVLDPIGSQTVGEGALLSLTLSASDPDGDALTLTAANLPTGAVFSDNGDGTASFEWTPDYGQAGNVVVLFSVLDDGTPIESDFEEVTISVGDVNRPPVLDPIPNQSVEEGVLLSFAASATDPDGDALTLTAANLPTGAVFSDNGDGTASFEWTPDYGQAGNYDITVTVTDDGVPAESAAQTVTLTVGAVNRPPVLAPIGSQTVEEGELLSLTLTASDPDGDALTLTAANLPTGAVFSDNGDGTASFEWTPDFGQAGNVVVLFSVLDDGTPIESDFEEVTISVGDVNRPPVLDPIPNQSVEEGVLLSFAASATDPDGDALTLTAANLPTGAVFSDNGDGTASFEWTPDYGQAGNYDITVTVTDDGVPAESAAQTVTLTVGAVNRPPVLAPIGSQTVEEGELLSLTLTASDPDGDALTLTAANLPTGAVFSDNGDGTASFEWTPDYGQAGSYDVTFTVTDDGVPAESDTEVVGVTVVQEGVPPDAQQVTLCSILGNDGKFSLLDQDIFEFQGQAGDTVTVTLEKDLSGTSSGDRASLLLTEQRSLRILGYDRSDLPNEVTVTLGKSGVYRVIVAEQAKLFRGDQFTGAYCVTLQAPPAALETFKPTVWVE